MIKKTVNNWVNGTYCSPNSKRYMDVISPLDGCPIAQVALSNKEDVNDAIICAEKAWIEWSKRSTKQRTSILLEVHTLIKMHQEELAELVMSEHGKTRVEALAEIAKGNETVEYACSMPQLISGKCQEVSRGVTCSERRDALGVTVSVVPFNFPFMVPFWTIPIALVTGNCMIVKPSEKVPLTMHRVVELFAQAGIPEGVLQTINGTKEAVEALCDHPSVKVVTFVGTSLVAESIAQRCHLKNKRVLALGGAKNHLVSAPDCNLEMTSSDIVNSFTGCSGQRCMAASVLITLGKQLELLDLLVTKAATLIPGQGHGQMGPVIDKNSLDKIVHYINEAERNGAKVLLDGRKWLTDSTLFNNNDSQHYFQNGYWIGPTIILHSNKNDPALHDEIFGPVLSIIEVETMQEAVDIQNGSPYGNASSIYTMNGGIAEWFSKRFHSGMIGINIGVPVPREPFSFGGTERSKFGDHDITGDSAIELFTCRRKITSKWTLPHDRNWMS